MKNTAALFLLMLFMTFGLLAQESYDEYTLEDSVTVTATKKGKVALYNSIGMKMPIQLRHTPASVGVIPRGLIANQGGLVLNDVLRNVSGVNPQAGNGVSDHFIIRGFNSLDNGLVMTDGTSEPEVMFYNTYNLERIEVLKGPGAFLYGANPLSGTVNLVRKAPIFDQFVRISGSAGHFNTYRGTLDAGYGDPNSGFALRLNGLFQQSDYYRDEKANETQAVNPSATWRINDRTTLHADYEYVNSEYSPDSGIPLQFNLETGKLDLIPDIDRKFSYQTPFDSSLQTMHRVKAGFSTQLSKNVILRNKFYYTDFNWDSNGALLVFGAIPIAPSTYGVPRLFNILDNAESLTGNQLEALINVRTGAVKHNILAGVEYKANNNVFSLKVSGIPLLLLNDPAGSESFNTDSLAGFARVPALSTGDAKSTTIAPYLVNQIQFNPQLQLFLGGRLDNVNYDRIGTDFDQPTNTSVESELKNSYSQFSPLGGIVFAPTEQASFYANIGGSFSPPSTLSSMNLEPEESSQAEFGIKYQMPDSKMIATLAIYNMEKKNIAIMDELGIPSQTGSQKSQGLEIDIVAEPIADWVTFINYAYTSTELTAFSEWVTGVDFTTGEQTYNFKNRSGNTPAFAPTHIANLWTTRQFESGLEVGAGFRYLGSQFIDEDNVFEIDPAFILDARVSYLIGKIRLHVNLNNISGTETFTRGFGNAAVIPSNPFTVLGGVDINL